MHYIDVGEGDPILFLHGQPTSSYLWRNIIPHLESSGRCIAPDLIGMGKSEKPDIGYKFEDHYEYLEKFIEQLGLSNITLVIHDWGSGLGFHYANKHRNNIKGIAFMEALIQTMTWDDFPPEYKVVFKLIRTPFIGWMMLSVANMFLNKVVPDSIIRKLSKQEFDHYKSPYPTVASRKPVRTWPLQIPINGKPKAVHDIITSYNKWLTASEIPKLCLYAHPGAIIKKKEVAYISNSFPNTTMVDIGKGIHYLQEDNPDAIGHEIAKWIQKI
jgi:haloalkane dehalogenase